MILSRCAAHAALATPETGKRQLSPSYSPLASTLPTPPESHDPQPSTSDIDDSERRRNLWGFHPAGLTAPTVQGRSARHDESRLPLQRAFVVLLANIYLVFVHLISLGKVHRGPGGIRGSGSKAKPREIFFQPAASALRTSALRPNSSCISTLVRVTIRPDARWRQR